MSLTIKSAKSSKVTLRTDLPLALPEIPSDVAERFPSITQWKGDLESWYYDLKKTLRRLIEDDTAGELNKNSTDLADLKKSLAASLADIQAQLDALSKLIAAAASDQDLKDLSESIKQVKASLNARLASMSASTTNFYFKLPTPGDINGPPTTGPHGLDELWIDKNRAWWISKTEGTPGIWRQITAAVMTEWPTGSVPVGYEVLREDLSRKHWRWDGSIWTPTNRKTFVQASAATIWGPFTHGMGVRPVAASVYVAGQIWAVQIVADTNTATVNFDFAKAGVLELDF